MIKIELTDEDAELFKLFREYQDQFAILIKHRVFKFYRGSAVIHKDEGKIMQININEIPFKRSKGNKKPKNSS